MRDWLALRADATPEATALAAAGIIENSLSYAELHDRAEILAGKLAATGVGVEDPVAICAATRPEFVTTIHALQRLGAITVPINARLTADEIESQLEWINPAAVLCESDTEPTVSKAVERAVLSFDNPIAGADPLASIDPEPFDLPEWEPNDPLLVMFTSGTTGEPKGVVLTLANILASATASAFRLGLRADDCWHVPLPMYHMGGLAPAYRSVLYGTTLSLQREFDPEQTLETLDTADATAVSLVPTMLKRLLDAGSFPDVRFVLLGGAEAPPELIERASDQGVPVAPTYGMTEAASQIATARPEEARATPGSVGHPLMFAEVSVVGPNGDPRETGETGELIVSGPMITPGYLDGTGKRFSNGGLQTGDRGYRDEAGRVYVLGRNDKTIVTGGENVDPEEVIEVLERHPAVEAASVVGLPDEEWGERVAALLVAEEVDAEEIESYCRGQLAGYKYPRTIAFAESLPRTASGTVDRVAVRDHLSE